MHHNAIVIVSFLLLSFCNSTSSDRQEKTTAATTRQEHVAEIDGIRFTLRQKDKASQITYQVNSETKTIDLLLPWPCQFHKSAQGSVRKVVHNGSTYFMLESSRPHPRLPNDCETQLQAVRIVNQGVHAAGVKSVVASCPPFQWDEMAFYSSFKE